MRKIISILVIVIALIATTVPSFADTPCAIDGSVKNETTVMDDGSYYITTIEESVPGISLRAAAVATSTKTGSATTSYYTSSGTLLWSVKVTGTFSYNGSTSSCTSSSVTTSVTSAASSWKITSKSVSKSGNQATGKATAKLYNGSIVLQTVSKTVILTCSKTGALS
jgi:hypothetical protein